MLADDGELGARCAVHRERCGEGFEEPLRGGFRVEDARPFDQHDELVATEAADRVCFAQGALKPDGGLAEHIVSDTMAQRVVDVLEPVEVDEEHRPVQAAAPAALLHLLDSVQDELPVRQSGQRVTCRQPLQRVSSRPELGDVVGGHHQSVDGRVVEEVDDAQLARHRDTPVATAQIDLDDGGALFGQVAVDRRGQGRFQGGAVGLDDEVLERVSLHEGLVVTQHPGDGGGHRLHGSGPVEEEEDAGRVVDEGPEALDVVGGHLPPAPLGQVAEAPHEPVDGWLADEVGADQFDELPSGRCLDPELDGGAHALVQDTRQRGHGQLEVLRVEEFERVGPDDLRVGQAEDPLRGRVAPHQATICPGHDDGIGQLQGEMLQPRRFHCPFPNAISGIGLSGPHLYPRPSLRDGSGWGHTRRIDPGQRAKYPQGRRNGRDAAGAVDTPGPPPTPVWVGARPELRRGRGGWAVRAGSNRRWSDIG